MKSQVPGLKFVLAVIVLMGAAVSGFAQSTDQGLPTPVTSNDISGRIKALDLGDPRSTRHFYAFEGSPGDLLITIDSKNLNGDIDVFTAVTFRPLMKTTVYASSSTPEITKGIYLRSHQILILRVEARTPNDEPGTYHIRFGGTFERFSGGIPVAEVSSEETDESGEKRGTNRLSSSGAMLPKPPPTEPVETAEAKPSPSPEKVEEKPAEKPAETAPAKKTTANNRRTNNRPPPRRSTRPAPAKPAPKKTDAAKTEKEKEKETEASKPAEETATPPEKSSEPATAAAKPKSQEPIPSARLIVEQKDGTRIDRPMSTVRRVVVEGTMIVITLKTGKIERIPMADVARMAIEPQ